MQHLIELFSRRETDYFSRLGIHSLVGHFRELEKALQKLVGDAGAELSAAEAEKILSNDTLFRALVVQRSRAYARRSQVQHGGTQVVFPRRATLRQAQGLSTASSATPTTPPDSC